MIEENQGFPEASAAPAEATPPAAPASPSNDATQEAINPDGPSQQQFFDNFTQLGLSDKEKLNLLNAQGFDPESNYGLIMDDYNRRQEDMLANQERLEALNKATSASMEDLKKKDSSSGSSGEGFESGGAEFEDQAFGQPVATADFRNVLTMRSDEHEANYMVLADQAGQLKLEAEYIEDLEEKKKKLAEAREIAAQANLEHGKAVKSQNGIYEMVGSDFRVNQESDVDEGFMQRNMFQRMKEEDARIKRDFGFVGVEDRADLEEYKQLRQEGAFVDQTLEELRAEEYDPIDGALESLYDNAFNTFGNLAFDRGIMVADLVGGEDSRMSKYWRGRKKQMNGKYQRARAAGMAELEIPEDYQGLGVMDTLGKALTGDMTALNKFVTYDLPETMGMTAVYAADFFAMGAVGRTVGATGKMSASLSKAGQLSTRANMLSAMSQSVPATLFSYIPQGYESYRESHPEAPIDKALFFGSLSGMAEGMMNAVTLGLGRGAEAAFARSVSGGMKQTIQKQVQEALKKKLSTGFLKDLGAEGLEEGMVAFTEQLISNASDVVDGKDPKSINFHSIADAFVVGALGASGPGALSVASSRLSHSSNLKDTRAQAKIVGEIRKKYEAEKDPQKKQVLRDTYMRSLQKFDIIKKKDAQMYDTFNQKEVDEVMGIHQEIASISSTLRKGEFVEGGRVTKEEKAELKERLTDLFTRKAQIEKVAEDRAFKASVPSEVVVPDSENKSRPAKERNVEQTEIDSHKRVPDAPQPAPAEQVQEEGQLLMFDENTMDNMSQRPGEEVQSPVEAAQQAEAPAAQQAEAAQQTESAVEEDAVTVDLAAGETLDLRDTKNVGEGAGQVSISNARTINNLTKAFGGTLKTAGAKVKAHRTMESFNNSNEGVKNQNKYLEVVGVDGQVKAYLNPLTNEIHLSPEADIMDVMEEFGHLVLAPVIGKDAASRQALFAEMQKIARGKSKGAKLVSKILAESNEDYGNQTEAVKEEEAIISVLVNYAANPTAFASVADKIVKAINKVLKAAGLKKNIITGKEGLFTLAEKFRQSSEGRATEVVTDAPVAEEAPAEQAAAEDALAEEAPAEEAPVAEEAEEAPAEESPAAEEAPKDTPSPESRQAERRRKAREEFAGTRPGQPLVDQFIRMELLPNRGSILQNVRNDSAFYKTVPGESGLGQGSIKAFQVRGEYVYAKYENDILADDLKNDVVDSGTFYYGGIGKDGPFQREWDRSPFGERFEQGKRGSIGGFQIDVKKAPDGTYRYNVFFGYDVGQTKGSDSYITGFGRLNPKGYTLAELKEATFDLRQQMEKEDRTPGMERTAERTKNAMFDCQIATRVLEKAEATIANPSRATEGRDLLQKNANEFANFLGLTLANDVNFKKQYRDAIAVGVLPPSTDQKVEAMMTFLNESEFYDWGKGKDLANRPAMGDMFRKALTNKINEVRLQDFRLKAEDIANNKLMSQAQKRDALKAQADAMLGDAEGTAVKDTDALDQAESLDVFEGRMSVRRKQEFNYLKDTEIFYTARPYLQAGEAVVTSSRYTTYSAPRSIRVNDYFHFRNWYNKTTGNQSANRVGEMYFIKDGKKYAIKTPRPRVDKDGKKVPMALPPSPKDINNQKKIQNIQDQKEVTRQLKELRDSNRAMFATIPWKQFVGAGQFSPASKPTQEMTINDQYISAVIEQKNMQEALDMGLTKDEVRDRIKQPGRAGIEGLNRIMDGDIVNATGLAPFDEAETGDVVSNIRFSTRRRKQLGDPDHILSDKELSDFLEGRYEDLTGVFMPISGYDQSMPDQQKGITSGIRAVQELDAADLPELEADEVVISTHVSFEYARQRMERYRKEAEKIYRKQEREGSPKAARKLNMIGKFGAGFSMLKPEATRGNPDVAKSYLNGLLSRSRDKDVNIGGPSMYEMFSGTGKKAIRNMVRMAQADGFGGLSSETAALFDAEFDLPVTTQKQFEEIIDVAINYNDRLADQFEGRKNLFSKKLLSEFFSHEKFELGRTIPDESLSMDEQIAEYFNDPVLSQQKPATLIGYKTFNYEIDPDIFDQYGQIKLANMRIVQLEGYGFGGAVVVKRPGPDAKLKVFKEQFTLDKIDPELFQTSEASSSKKAAEVAKAKTPYDKAEMLNRYSRVEFNAEAQDVNIKASVRRRQGFVKGETTNGSWQMRDMNGFQRWRNTWLKRLQDKYVDIFQLQSDVESTRGKRTADQDFQMAEELMYGKAAEDLRKLDVKVDAITDLIKDRGLSVQDVSDYLYAMHAKERNELIRERTNGQNKEGSGMSDARADLILKSLEGRSDSLKEVVDLVREIQQDTRDTMVKFGLETQEAIDAFEAQFENYVPLSGIAIDEETSFTSSYPTGGAGMSVFGPATKRAEGRQSEATNILAQVIAQNSSIHIKARTNEALQSLYNLVESNPNEDVWRILDAKNVNSKDPHIVSVRVNGEQKFIRFKDASYAETLRNMNLPQTSVFVRMMRAPANWLRRSFTTLNPEFMISNFSRDIQAAMFNAAAEADIPGGVIEGQGIVTEMIKNVPKTLKVLLRSESPEALKKFFAENPEVERYYNEFRDDGGKTGWSYAKPLDRIASDLQSKSSDKSKMQNLFGKAEEFAQVVEGYNDAFENSIRLSSYIAAREKGVTREKAAQMAKNITVNFNKSGEYGQMLNSVYLFFNASVQGTARLGKSLLTMKSPTYPDGTKREFKDRFNNAQKMAAALTVFSGLSAMIAMAMSDEDEDGELYYNKIPDYIKERNLIFMRPNGKDYFKIPLPYGFSMFANLGTTAVEVGAGHKEIDTAMMQLSSSFINSFSPISFGQSKDLFTKAGKSVVPTVFKPLVDVMTNETYFGGPVYTENLPYGLQRPESSMSFRSPEGVQQFFRWMNEATGGSVDVKGDLDFNPDKMWYMFEYFIGGAGKFVERTGSTALKLKAKAEDNDIRVEANDIPFMRILYGEPSKYMDMEDYSRRRQEIMQLTKELKNNPRRDKGERYVGVLGLNNSLKSFDKMLKAVRAAKRQALKIKDYTERMKRIQELRDKERKIVMRFNKQYETIRGKED